MCSLRRKLSWVEVRKRSTNRVAALRGPSNAYDIRACSDRDARIPGARAASKLGASLRGSAEDRGATRTRARTGRHGGVDSARRRPPFRQRVPVAALARHRIDRDVSARPVPVVRADGSLATAVARAGVPAGRRDRARGSGLTDRRQRDATELPVTGTSRDLVQSRSRCSSSLPGTPDHRSRSDRSYGYADRPRLCR